MHFEILVEDQSGVVALNILVPRIIDPVQHTWKLHPYKGIGAIPKGMKPKTDAEKRMLLDQLPRLLNGFGKTHQGYGPNYPAAVIVVCDLDRHCLRDFRHALLNALNSCTIQPVTRFCIAIEEGEAWLLGDPVAVRAAYPKAKQQALDSYINDSICGTWEKLADAVHPGGSGSLLRGSWHVIGRCKSEWAARIAPLLDIDHNASPSFGYFRSKLEELAQ